MEADVMTGVAFRHNLTETLTRVSHGTAVKVTHYGRPTAVVVPHEWYERAKAALESAGSDD